MKDSDLRKTTKVLYLTTGEQTKGLYSRIEILVPPGGGPPPHTHTKEEERFYVLEGEFQLWIGDNPPKNLAAGDCATGPKGIQHCFRNVGETTGRLRLLFTPAGLEEYFKELEKARAQGGANLLEQEEALDEKYGIIINRRQ